MRKSLTALVAAATIAGSLAVGATDASAQWRRGWGWGPGAGIAAGIVGGAIVAGALSQPYCCGGYGYYAPGPVYYDYYQPAPAYFDYYVTPPQPEYYSCWRWRNGARYRVC